MKNIIFLICSFFIINGCNQFATPNPTKLTDQNECIPACANLQKLGCEEGLPIRTRVACVTSSDCPNGQSCAGDVCTVSCAQFCIESENNGIWLQPTCVSHISSCTQVQDCEEKK